jgi:hypothetical protein
LPPGVARRAQRRHPVHFGVPAQSTAHAFPLWPYPSPGGRVGLPRTIDHIPAFFGVSPRHCSANQEGRWCQSYPSMRRLQWSSRPRSGPADFSEGAELKLAGVARREAAALQLPDRSVPGLTAVRVTVGCCLRSPEHCSPMNASAETLMLPASVLSVSQTWDTSRSSATAPKSWEHRTRTGTNGVSGTTTHPC